MLLIMMKDGSVSYILLLINNVDICLLFMNNIHFASSGTFLYGYSSSTWKRINQCTDYMIWALHAFRVKRQDIAKQSVIADPIAYTCFRDHCSFHTVVIVEDCEQDCGDRRRLRLKLSFKIRDGCSRVKKMT